VENRGSMVLGVLESR